MDIYNSVCLAVIRVHATVSVTDPNATAIDPENHTWHVYVRIGEAPTTSDYDFNFTLPLTDSDRVDMVRGKANV